MSGDRPEESVDRKMEALARELRAAARSDLSPGAARRIADGAWRRDADRREAGRAPLLGGARWGRTRRVAVAASLVAAAGIGVLALQGTEPAFAVDGDPVQVWDGAEWEEALRVDVGALVFVPEGARTLRGRDGSRIEPLPGACFRLEADVQELRFRVNVLHGRTEVLGRTLSLEVADVRVEPESPAGLRVDVDVESTAQWGFTPPTDPVSLTWTGTPLIRSGGNVRLLQHTTGQSLMLQPAEAATLVMVEEAAPLRLARVETWSPAVPEQIAAGRFVVNLDLANGRFVTYGDGDFKCVLLPAAETHLALQQVNEAALESLAFLNDMRVREAETLTRLMSADAAPQRELRFEKDGATVLVRILANGAASLQRGSQAPEHFHSVDALRDADPEAAAVFGKLLED